MPTAAPSGGSLGRGARARILAAAQACFSRQGMVATSVNDLRAQARVSKRTLYEHFPSKDELLIAYLGERGLSAAETVLDREQLTPRARLLELFTALGAAEHARPDPVLAAAIEFPDRAHAVHRAATHQSERLLGRLRALAEAAGAADPDQTARQLALVYAGAAARLLVDDAEAVIGDAHRLAASILRAAIDHSGTDRST